MHGIDNTLDLIRSPKLNPVGPRWYRYYAGFDPRFVSDVCDVLQLKPGDSTLDPWMGSGTALGVAATRGVEVAGIDLNPAMVVVAKGRLLANDTLKSLDPLGADIVRGFSSYDYPLGIEPLRHWFDAESSRYVRGLALQIRKTLVSNEGWPCNVDEMSSLACFYFVALFEAVTQAVKSYGSRNPTWIKTASAYEGTVELSKSQLSESFVTAVKRLSTYLRSSHTISTEIHNAAVLSTGDSRRVPFGTSKFDSIITSPPYLTRLDYVRGHAPELAVLGYDGDDLRALRDSMIGTPTRRDDSSDEVDLGSTAQQLLSRIRDHGTYAAKSYYEPNFRQYFVGMAKSFDEIQRVAKPSANVVLVVQDSRFKDIHIDLAAALIEMGASRGWKASGRKDFTNVRSMAQLNKNAHPITRATKPVESAVSFVLPAASGDTT